MSVDAQLDAGNLTEAIAVATADVKRDPSRPELRAVLAELMCLVGNYERAETLVEAAIKFYKQPAPGFALLWQLIKGETTRQQWFRDGSPAPTGADQHTGLVASLQVLDDVRNGLFGEAVNRIATQSDQSPLTATVQLTSGEPCTGPDFRDLNDLTANLAELITMAGKYCWLPWSEVHSVKFHPVTTLRDLIWRPAEIARQGGEVEQAFMPCLYAGSAQADDDAIRLGRQTLWNDLGSGLISGSGQRMFLVGDSAPSLLEISEIRLSRGDEPHGRD